MEEGSEVVVFVPVVRGRMAAMKHFYADVLKLAVEEGGSIRFPGSAGVSGQLQYLQKDQNPVLRPIFQFAIDKDFPTFCVRLKAAGVKFDLIAMTPGGYLAQLLDPSENRIQVACSTFEDSLGADISGLSEYQRY